MLTARDRVTVCFSVMSFVIKHSLKDKEQFFELLAKKFHDAMAIKEIGKTAGGKTMIAVHITGKLKTAPADRPKIYIQCLIHGSK